MIALDKMSNDLYLVYFNTKYIGEFVLDIDGFFYFRHERDNTGLWSQGSLQAIVDKLRELNKEWEEQIERQMMKDKVKEFLHLTICRSNDARQKKAEEVFTQMRKTLQPEKAWQISNEWNHYLMREMTAEQFAESINNILKDEMEEHE